MLTELAAPFDGIGAAALAVTLAEPPAEAAVTHRLALGRLDVEIRLPGFGHQVIVGPVVETVGVLDGRPGPLPYELNREVGGWSYRFLADVYRRRQADFALAAGFLHGYLADRAQAVAVTAAGRPGAIGGVLVRTVSRGIGWRAWHTVPETREIVVTRGRMLVR